MALLKLKERRRIFRFSFVQLLVHRLGEYAVQRGGLRKKVAGRQLFTFSILRVAMGQALKHGKRRI